MLRLSGRAFITLPVFIAHFISLPATSSPFRHLVNLGYIDAGSSHFVTASITSTMVPAKYSLSLAPIVETASHELPASNLANSTVYRRMPSKHNQNVIKNCSFHAKYTYRFLAVGPLSVSEWVPFCFLLVTLSLIRGSSIQTTPASPLFSQQPACILPTAVMWFSLFCFLSGALSKLLPCRE